FSNRSMQFMDGYRKGLNGSEAAWAMKKYRGHCCLPPSMALDIEQEREKAIS
ncbi:hypothetical protein BS47DRAFT_1290165, partial [Hydnum rufescens UP504]